MRFLRCSLTGVFLVSLTAALLVSALALVWRAIEAAQTEGGRPPGGEERVFAANVLTFEAGTVVPLLTTYGEVRSRRTLEVRAGAGGTVVELAEEVEEGGYVEAGQLIAKIDPADAQAALDTAEADLAEAEAELADAEGGVELAALDLEAARTQAELRRQALERQSGLLERGVGSAINIESAELDVAAAEQAVVSRRQAQAEAEARLARARIALDRSRIALAEAERALEETEVHAEFSGVLSEVVVVEGGLVTANERLATLIDSAALEVAFRLSTAQYARLLDETGTLRRAEVTASLDVLGLELSAQGTITRESGLVGEGQTGRLLYARLEDAAAFRPGDFVTVTIEEPALEQVAMLPAGAVDSAGTVLVVGAENRLSVAPVELLRRQGDRVVVRAAALEGEAVVAERSPMLGAGLKVRPTELDPEALAAGEAPEMMELNDAERARLVAFVEASTGMPEEAKARVLGQLRAPQVPAQVVRRIERRMDG